MKKIVYMLLLFMFASCDKADKNEPSTVDPNKWTLVEIQEPLMAVSTRGYNTISEDENVMMLGKKLKNPYSVNNMRIAYNNLTKTGGAPNIDIKATHLYLKFSPKDSTEFETLKELKTVEFYSYPLDYEILSEGVCSDPAVEDDGIPTLWAAVRIDQKLPANLNYEVLDYLFIPEKSTATKSGNEYLSEDFIDQIETEALRITHNDGEIEIPTRSKNKWYPNGRIQVYDDALNRLMPLEGVKVRARRWFTTKIMYTNRQGYFEAQSSFKRPANYSIVWEGDYWDIRSGIFGQAFYKGPKMKDSWNLNIESGRTIRYAHMHRAAYRWFHKNTYGFSRPNYDRKIKISYRNKNKRFSGDFWRNFTCGILPDIRIFKSTEGRELKMHEIFSTTIHELGHASHASNSRIYGKTKNIICESWASFAEDQLTKEDYKEWAGRDPFSKVYIYFHMNRPWPLNYPDSLNMQDWTGYKFDDTDDYTPLFIDIHDNSNQRLLGKLLKDDFANNYVNDNVGIADIRLIEYIAFNSKTITDVKNKLKALAGKTSIPFSEQDVDNLLEFY